MLTFTFRFLFHYFNQNVLAIKEKVMLKLVMKKVMF